MKRVLPFKASLKAYFSFTIFLALLSLSALAQPGSMSNNTNCDGSYFNNSMTTTGIGTNNTIFTYREQANATTTAGTKLYQFNSDGYNNKWDNNQPAYNTVVTASWGSSGGGGIGCSGGCYNGSNAMRATVLNSYYTFNIRKGSSYANQSMAILETSFLPQTINSVTASLNPNASATASVTMAGALSSGEYLYVAYSTDAFATSGNSGIVAVGSLNGSFIGTATIPTQSAGTRVTYYAFTSTSSTAPSFSDAPILTLNMRNSVAQNTTGIYSTYLVDVPRYFCSGHFNPPNSFTEGSAQLMSSLVGNSSTTYYLQTTGTVTGNSFFKFFGATSGGIYYGPLATTNADSSVPTNKKFNLGTTGRTQGKSYFISGTNTDVYVVKSGGVATSAQAVIFRIGASGSTVKSVSSVTQSPISGSVNAGNTVTVTASIGSGSFSTGQAAYLRYSTSSTFATSAVVAMTGSGPTYTADIPSGFNTSGIPVYYYVFTSGSGSVGPASDGSDADLFSMNLNNNGGANYTYTPTGFSVPSLTLPTAASITNNSAVLGATITNENGASVTDYGTVWHTSTGVTIANNKLSAGINPGAIPPSFLYTHTRSSLSAQTPYYYKGYATNSVGDGLSSEGSFYTLSNPPTVQASSFSAPSSTSSSINLSWSAATFPGSGATTKGYVLLRATSPNTPSLSNTNGAAPAAGVNTTIVNSSITEAATTASAAGLAFSTTYNFLLVPFTWDGTNAATYNYLTSAAPTTSGTTLSNTVTSNGTGGGNWNSTATWSGGVVPTNTNDVVIQGTDNVTINTSINPSGTITVASTATLTLDNTINVGGAVGSVVVNGTLIHATSGTVSGTNDGILINGTFQLNKVTSINQTIKYGASSLLKINSGTSFALNTISNVWINGNSAAGSRIPASVQISGSSTLTINNSNYQINGTFTVDNGSTCIYQTTSNALVVTGSVINNGTLTSSSGDMNVGGDWTKGSGATFTHNDRTVTFNKNGTQTISAVSGTETFGKIVLSNTSSLLLSSSPATSVIIATASGLTLTSPNTSTSIDLNGQSMTLTGGGNLSLNSGTRNIVGGAGSNFAITTTAATITNSGSLIFGSNVKLRLAAGLTTGTITVNGTLQIDGGGFISGTSPTYGASSTLVYNTTSYNVNDTEFPPTGVKNVTITRPSAGANLVTLNNSKTITGLLTIGDHQILGGKSISAADITIGNAGVLDAGNITTSSSLVCTGNSSIILTGWWSVTGFTKGTSTVNFAGTGDYNNTTSFYNLTNSVGTRSIKADINVENTLNVTGGQMGVTSGSFKTLTMSGSASTLNINGGAIYGTDAGAGNDLRLVISGAQTTLTGAVSGALDDEKKFHFVTVNSGSTLILARGILCKYGTFTCNGTIQINANGYVQSDVSYGANAKAPAYNASTGSLIYNNGGPYTNNAEWPATNSPANVTVQNGSTVIMAAARTIGGNLSFVSGAMNLNSTGNLTINGTLTLGSSIIATGTSTVIVSSTTNGSITRTTGFVNGNLMRTFAAGASTLDFPVGAATTYAPVSVDITGVSGAVNLTAKVTNGNPAAGSAIDQTKKANHYWTLTKSGAGTLTNYDVTLDFTNTTNTGNTANYILEKYDGSWASTTSSITGNTIKGTGLVSFSDFETGEIKTHTITYNGNTNTGGSVPIDGNSPYNYNSTVTVLGNTGNLTKTGNSFIGWNTAANGSGTAYTAGATLAATANITLYAQWCSGNTFTGNNSDFSNGANWSCGVAPTSNSGEAIVINSGSGVVTLDVDFDVKDGSFDYNGSNAGDTLVIAPGVVLKASAGGTIDFNGNPVLIKSDATGTGSIGEITGTLSGATNVTAERYIRENDYRGWRLLAVPFQTSGTQTIRQSWQEGAINYAANPHPGFGTRITSNVVGAVGLGYDGETFGNSLLTYDGSLASPWVGHQAGTGVSVSRGTAGDAWMLYVRGDRSVDTAGVITAPTETVLRAKGALYTTNPPISIPVGQNGLIGNILPSEIDFLDVIAANPELQVVGGDSTFYVWDPRLYGSYGLGGYQTFSRFTSTPWEPSPGGGSYGSTPSTKIQSGMGFFVHNSQATPLDIQLTESCKSDGANVGGTGFRPAAPAAAVPYIKTKLYSVVGAVENLADGNEVSFDASYTNDINNRDNIKIAGFGDGIGMVRGTTILSTEQRQFMVSGDVIQYRMTNLKKQAYKLTFDPGGLSLSGATAILEDKYLNTAEPLSLSTITNKSFNADPAIVASFRERFRIVFTVPTPVAITNLSAQQKNTAMQVEWKVSVENGVKQYEVEHSTDGTNFSTAGTVSATANNGAAVAYSFMDAAPTTGVNYYRIKTVDLSGAVKYTSVVRVSYGSTVSSIVLSSTIITGNQMSLQLNNQDKGRYSVRLINTIGQELMKTSFTHGGGNSTQSVSLPSLISKGIYQLEIVRPNGTKVTEKLIMN